jgi:pimeloyl-ACP methyl ester carboxylesterase
MTEGRLGIPGEGGLPIAVWVEGSGRPLVMVHGSIADHNTFASFISVLRDKFEVYAMDRRGLLPHVSADSAASFMSWASLVR